MQAAGQKREQQALQVQVRVRAPEPEQVQVPVQALAKLQQAWAVPRQEQMPVLQEQQPVWAVLWQVQVKVLIQLVPGLLKELSVFLQNPKEILNLSVLGRVPAQVLVWNKALLQPVQASSDV